MKCSRCQHENEVGAKFCEECAVPLARACAQCGRLLAPTAKFCPECAHPTGVSAAPPTAQRFDSPESYTPKHLAEKILTSKAALEGERKQVTVLFADLKGSMELLADRDPEEARKLLDPVLERMMEAVHHYEGTVNQVMGDGIMALFGAPIGHEDHAVRACYAALRMQRRVALYADELQRAGGTPVQIRVGLNSGEVVVRAIGSDLHMDYTAVGQTTHLAARMEQMAKPGVGAGHRRHPEAGRGVRPGQAARGRPREGARAPAPVYELTGTVAARSRFQASAARGLTRFVGRERELQQLAQALERAAAGHGQVVAVVGEAGVGKSRLVWEFTRSHRTHGWLVLESGSVSYGKATPYLPVIELLKAYLPDPGARRPAGDPRARGRQAPDAGPRAGAAPDAAPGAAGCPRRRCRVGRPRPAPTPAAHPGGGQATAAPRKPGPAAPRALRGSPLDRRRDPGAARRPHREPADRPRSCSWSTTGPSTSTPGAARPTTSSCGSTRCRPRAPRRCSTPCWGRTGPSSRSSGC